MREESKIATTTTHRASELMAIIGRVMEENRKGERGLGRKW